MRKQTINDDVLLMAIKEIDSSLIDALNALQTMNDIHDKVDWLLQKFEDKYLNELKLEKELEEKNYTDLSKLKEFEIIHDLVFRFHKLVSEKKFIEAWHLLSPSFHKRKWKNDFHGFKNSFKILKSIGFGHLQNWIFRRQHVTCHFDSGEISLLYQIDDINDMIYAEKYRDLILPSYREKIHEYLLEKGIQHLSELTDKRAIYEFQKFVSQMKFNSYNSSVRVYLPKPKETEFIYHKKCSCVRIENEWLICDLSNDPEDDLALIELLPYMVLS